MKKTFIVLVLFVLVFASAGTVLAEQCSQSKKGSEMSNKAGEIGKAVANKLICTTKCAVECCAIVYPQCPNPLNPICAKEAECLGLGYCPRSACGGQALLSPLCEQVLKQIPTDWFGKQEGCDEAEELGLEESDWDWGNNIECESLGDCHLEPSSGPPTTEHEVYCYPGAPYDLEGNVQEVLGKKHFKLGAGGKIEGPCLGLEAVSEIEIRINSDGIIEIFGGQFKITKPLGNVRFDNQPTIIPEVSATSDTIFDVGGLDHSEKAVKVTGAAVIKGLHEDGPLEFKDGNFFASENTLFFNSPNPALLDTDFNFESGVGASLPYYSAIEQVNSYLQGGALAPASLNMPSVIGVGGKLSDDSKVVASKSSKEDSPDAYILDEEARARYRAYGFDGTGLYLEDSEDTEDLLVESLGTGPSSMDVDHADYSQHLRVNEDRARIDEQGQRTDETLSANYLDSLFKVKDKNSNAVSFENVKGQNTNLDFILKNTDFGQTYTLRDEGEQTNRLWFERDLSKEVVQQRILIYEKYSYYKAS